MPDNIVWDTPSEDSSGIEWDTPSKDIDWDSPGAERSGLHDFIAGLNRSKEELFRSGARGLNELGIGGYNKERLEKDRSEDIRGESGWDTAGEVVGDIAITGGPAGKAFQLASKVPTIAKVPAVLQKALKYGTAGAATGAGSSAITGGDTDEIINAAKVGGVLGPVIPAVGKSAIKARDVLKTRFAGINDQVSRAAQDTFGDRLPGAIQALKNLKPTVQGEKMLPGHAASVDGGLYPEFKAYENYALGKGGGGELNAIKSANREARDSALGRIGSKGESQGVTLGDDPTTLKSLAETKRDIVTRPQFDKIKREMVEIPDELEAAIKGPELLPPLRNVTNASEQAELLANSGRRSANVDYIPGQQAQPASGQIVNNNFKEAVEAVPTQRSIENLQSIKNELNKRVKRQIQRGDDTTSTLDALRQVDDLATSNVPDFGKWKQAYKAESMPQNQADVVNVLRDKLNRGSKESIAPFLKQAGDVTGTLKQAGLPSNMKNLETVFKGSPEDLAVIRGVQKSAGNEALFNQTPAAAGNLLKPQSASMALESLLPPFLTKNTAMFRRFLQRTGDVAEDQIDKLMIELSQSREKMIEALERTPPHLRNKIVNFVRDNNPEISGAIIGATQTGE